MNNDDQAIATGWLMPPAQELHKKWVAAQLEIEERLRLSPEYQEIVASINEQIERCVSNGFFGVATYHLPNQITPSGMDNEHLLRVIANDYECNGYEANVGNSWSGKQPGGEGGIGINVNVPHSYIQGKIAQGISIE